ncbi:uncharacterized protein LOC100175554 [Ciona intestinalis]
MLRRYWSSHSNFQLRFCTYWSQMSVKHHSVSNYQAPEWAKDILRTPEKRVKLALLPTPIHKWRLDGLPKDVELFIKRDDMTGSTLSGNKVRKLEFILGDALSRGCKSVITCGSIQSNHCRATAVAARELGLDSYLLLRNKSSSLTCFDNLGNLLPSMLCGSQIYFIPKNSKYETTIKPKQKQLAREIEEKTGNPACCIPVGGSNSIGVFGYIEAWKEMEHQNVCTDFDDVVIACGSGGSIAGLAIGNYLTGQKIKLHAVSVCDDKYFFHEHVNQMLNELGISGAQSEDLVDIIDGYKGEGYGLTTKQDHEFLHNIASTTGILCDPVYTGKAVKGMITELNNTPGRFKGNRVLYIHTGGVFGLFDSTINSKLERKYSNGNMFSWFNDFPEKIA